MKQKNTSHYVDLGNLLFDSSFLDVRMEVALRDVTQGGDFEALPDPFVQINLADRKKYYLASLQFGKGFYRQDVLLNVLPRSGSMDSALLAKTSSLTNMSETMAHILEFDGLKNKKAFNATFICKREKVLFHPPCPVCGKGLKNYDEDTSVALVNKDLSDHPLLYCSVCKSDNSEAKYHYYRNTGTAEGEGSTVGGRLDLITGFGQLMRRPDVKVSDFPCVSCAGKAKCYPESNVDTGLGDAIKLIVPFSFESFQLVAYEYLPLRFHEYANLVGGQDWQGLFSDMEQRRDYDRLQILRAKFGDIVEHRLAVQPASLSTTLHVKLSAFQKLCKALLYYHQNIQLPYGEGLSLGGMLDIDDDMIPQVMSACRVKLKPPSLDKSNTASMSNQLSNRCSGQLSVTLVDAVGENEQQGVKVRVELSSVALLNHRVVDGEVFVVHLGLGEGFTPEIDVAFEMQSQQGDRFMLQSVETLTDVNVATQFRTLRHLPYVDVSFVITQTPGIEGDLEQLGHMLLCALLCNAHQTEQNVRNACIDLLHQFEPMLASSEDEEELSHVLQELIIKNDALKKIFQSTNVFYFPDKVRGNDFYLAPDPSWVTSVFVGLRLMSRHQKLSYLDSSITDEQRWQIIDKVIVDVEQIILLLSGGLFDNKTENQELMSVEVDNDIYSILSKVIKDPEWLTGVLEKKHEVLSPIGANEPVAASLVRAVSQRGYETAQRTISNFSTDDTMVSKPGPSLDENLDETLIISKNMVRESHEKIIQEKTVAMQSIPESHEIPKDTEIDLEETIVLSRTKKTD